MKRNVQISIFFGCASLMCSTWMCSDATVSHKLRSILCERVCQNLMMEGQSLPSIDFAVRAAIFVF